MPESMGITDSDQLNALKDALHEWLIRNELDGDIIFYSTAEWIKRGEEYLNNADLILVFEGNLYSLLNFGGDTEEFDDYIESFGFYYELGNAWNMGFYQIPDYDFTKLSGSYAQKLRDDRWRKKAALVRKRAGECCQDCGSTDRLEVHHCYYSSLREGHEPWQYPLSALRCLCRSCHISRARSEMRMRAYLARFTTDELDELRLGLDNAIYWCGIEPVIRLLGILGKKENEVQRVVSELLDRANDVE
jgi:hypothetical protein